MSYPSEQEGRASSSGGADIDAAMGPVSARGTWIEPPAGAVERAVLAVCRLIRISTIGPDQGAGAPGAGSAPAIAAAPSAAEIDRQIEETSVALRELTRRASSSQGTSFLFSQGVVFVSRRLLKSTRATYEEVTRIGQVLDRCGISEIAIAKDVFPADLKTLSTLLQGFHRSPEPVVPERITPRIRLRAVHEAARRHETSGEQEASGDAAIVQTYASAIVLMRRFYEALERGRYALPRRFRRIAQRLVDLSAGETPAFLGVTAARNANHDDAGRAVNTAVLSLAMARQITTDVLMLERVAMAALLYDTARPRLTGRAQLGGEGGASIIPDLSEQQDAEIPPATAVVLTALGRVTEASVVRTVLAYEAHWVKRIAELGPLYRGLRPPLLQARIIAVARAFNDLLTPAPGRDALAADGAIGKLEKEAALAADRTVLRLLIGALGIFPTGTLVELSTGEVALVVQTPPHPALYSQPRVRLVFDSSGGALDRAIEIDLAQTPPTGEPPRHIRRVVATSDDAAASTMRSFASKSSSGSGGGATTPHHLQSPTPPGRGNDRTPPRQGGKGASQVLSTRDAGSETPVSRARRTHSPPTPATVPASVRGGTLEAMAQLAAVSAQRQEASVPWSSNADAEPDSDSDVGHVTRQLPWHNAAYLLLMEQVEAHRAAAHGGGAASRSERQLVAPPPTAEGTLARTPLVHLLVYMLDRTLTGTTIFQTPRGINHTIYFQDGHPVKVRTGSTVAPLDEVILELGLLEEDVVLEAMANAQDQKVLLGRYLISHGLLEPDAVITVLNTQLTRKLFALFPMEASTQYAYYDSVNLLDGYAGPELFTCEPLSVVMAGVRASAQDQLVNATLERIGARAITLHPDGDSRRFRFNADEMRVVDLIRGKRVPVADILKAGIAPSRVVRLTLYALAITRHLDVGVAGRPPVGVGGETELGPASLRGGPIVLREAPMPAREGSRPHAQSPSQGPFVPPPPPSSAPVARAPAAAPSAPSAARAASPALRPGLQGMFPKAPAVADSPTPAASPPPPSAQVVPSTQTSPWRPPMPPRREEPPLDLDMDDGKPVSSSRQAVPPPPPPSRRPGPAASPGSSPDRAPRPLPPVIEANRLSPLPVPPVAAREPGVPPSRPSPAPAPPQERLTPLAGASPRDPIAATTVGERRAEIERRAASIDKEDYFTVLGVSPDSSSGDLQSAYFALAKRWHPDRMPAELADAKPLVARIFARVTEAYRTLSDPAKRADYIRLRDQTGASTLRDEQEIVARAVDAAVEFKKAEVLLKKSDLAGAEALAKKAAQADPDQPEYITLLVWIQALRRGNPPPVREGRSTGFYDDLIKTLDAVITKEPSFERALFYRATLLKRSGRVDKALADFRQVVELNPRNIDAAREVRLHGMRSRAGAAAEPAGPKGQGARKGEKPPGDGNEPPEGGGGLFNKLFKR